MALALEKLGSVFGMERVMIGGGGVLNWSLLNAGLVDEISRVVSPFADGDPSQPGLFSAVEPLSAPKARSFSLLEVRELRDSVLLVRYRANPDSATRWGRGLGKRSHARGSLPGREAARASRPGRRPRASDGG